MAEEKPNTKTGTTEASFIREPKGLYHSRKSISAVLSPDDLPLAETSIQFALIRDPEIRVILPIPVTIEHNGDTVVAAWSQADEYGYGENRSEALEDFGQSVSQLFRTLSSDEKALGSEMSRVLDLLRRHIQFRSR